MQVLDSYDPAGLSRVKNSIKVSNSGELAYGLELQAQIIVRAALAVLKQQPIGRHPKTLGDLLERLRAGL